MPPIPVYTDSPIHPTKPSGITPQTAFPAADSAQSPTPTRTTAAPTTAIPHDPTAPPPPQPGARPVPPTAAAATPTSAAYAPSPPAPGAVAAPRVVTATITSTTTLQQGPPPQLGIPPPGQNYAGTRSTDYTQGAQARDTGTQPTTLPLGAVIGPTPASVPAPPTYPPSGGTVPAPLPEIAHEPRPSLEHPPGYIQNPYAADGTAAQRASFEAAAAREREETGAGSMWGSVKGWVGEVGEKVRGVEEGVWRWAGK